MTATPNQTHALYRFFGHAGELLYIGITANPGARWPKHISGKPWWTEVSKIDIESHPDRPIVLAAEKLAIQNERPRYNVVYSGTRPPAVVEATTQESVVALGLRDGRCPVGLVESWDEWIRLTLFSFWDGTFSGPAVSYRVEDVAEIHHARLCTTAEKHRCRLTDFDGPVWHTALLGLWQAEWKQRHGLIDEMTVKDVYEDYAELMHR